MWPSVVILCEVSQNLGSRSIDVYINNIYNIMNKVSVNRYADDRVTVCGKEESEAVDRSGTILKSVSEVCGKNKIGLNIQYTYRTNV